MELLDRYLLQVQRYLPLKDREDTIKELKGLLLEDYDNRIENGENNEDALYNLLKDFGDPKEVALKYRNDAPIISREMEPFLYLVLKIVIITAPAGILLARLIDFASSNETFNLMKILLEVFYSMPAMVEGAIFGAGFVFIMFFLVGRYITPNIVLEVNEFEPNHLPLIPSKVFKVSLFESVFSISAGILFLYLINYQQGLISIYLDGNSYRLLNDHFNDILSFININVMFGIVISFIHVFKRKKTMVTSTLELMSTMFGGAIFLMLATGSIFNEVIIDGYDLDIIPTLFVIGMYVGAVLSFIGGIVIYVKVIIQRSGTEELIKDTIRKLDEL